LVPRSCQQFSKFEYMILPVCKCISHWMSLSLDTQLNMSAQVLVFQPCKFPTEISSKNAWNCQDEYHGHLRLIKCRSSIPEPFSRRKMLEVLDKRQWRSPVTAFSTLIVGVASVVLVVVVLTSSSCGTSALRGSVYAPLVGYYTSPQMCNF
jgi:hypothetical protein